MAIDKPILANQVVEGPINSAYPLPFAALMEARSRKKLGDHFGLENFGVNLITMSSGAISALKHQHLKQDEFIYILSGNPTLLIGDREFLMESGQCFGFRCGDDGAPHQLVNRSGDEVVYLEIGDRSSGDHVFYPDDDLRFEASADGSRAFLHKDGSAY